MLANPTAQSDEILTKRYISMNNFNILSYDNLTRVLRITRLTELSWLTTVGWKPSGSKLFAGSIGNVKER